jgi:hypothetical protein
MITVILSSNDLESKYIAELCCERSNLADVIDLKTDWGVIPNFDNPKIQKLLEATTSHTILIIELPSKELERRLSLAGHKVEVIDHHTISNHIVGHQNRFNSRTSIQQFAAFTGWTFNDLENQRIEEISANDTGSWFGLVSHFYDLNSSQALEKATEIRAEEQAVRALFGKTNKQQDWSFWQNKGYKHHHLKSGLGKKHSSRDFHFVFGPTENLEEVCEAFQKKQVELKLKEIDAATTNNIKKKDMRRNLVSPEILFIGVKTVTANDKQIMSIEKVFFTCGAAGYPIITDINKFQPLKTGQDLQIVTGGNEKRHYLYGTGGEDMLSRLTNLILDNCMHGVKPLIGWQSTFIHAITIPENEIDASSPMLQAKMTKCDGKGEKCSCHKQNFGLVELSLSARNYFLPALRKYMTPTTDEAKSALQNINRYQSHDVHPIISWNIPLNGAFSLTLQNMKEDEDNHGATVVDPDGQHLKETLKSLTLHWGYDDIVYLEWCFENTGLAIYGADESSTWAYLTHHDFKVANDVNDSNFTHVSTAAQLLDFNYGARMCYSAGKRGYSDQRNIVLIKETEKDCISEQTLFGTSESDSQMLNGWFAMLAEEALQYFKQNFLPPMNRHTDDLGLLLDERARFISTMVPIGGPATLPSGIERAEVMRARFAGGDDYQDHHFYEKEFAIKELNDGTYRRFAPFSLYQCTSHSFTLISYGGFAVNVLAGHMKEHYARMFLVLQASVCTFQKLWNDLIDTSAMRNKTMTSTEREDKASLQLEKMVNFSNVFWFNSVSSHLQGQELFSKMRDALPVEREHMDLSDEISNTERVLEAKRASKAEKDRDRFGLLFGILAVFVAFFELQDKYFTWRKLETENQLDGLWAFTTTNEIIYTLIALTVLIIIFNKQIYRLIAVPINWIQSVFNFRR